MRFSLAISLALALSLAACATSSIQPMAKDTFKVATNAAPACGPNGARNVAFRTAAVEVLRRGGDKFILIGDNSKSEFWTGDYQQDMVVKVVPEKSAEARNALSARDQLGPSWREYLAKGTPITCAE